MSSPSHPKLAVGPVMPGWGSWEWVGMFLIEHLSGPFQTTAFNGWDIPDADVIIVIKHTPPDEWIETVTRRAILIYCPINAYGDATEIEADAWWLRKCTRVIVHCHKLQPHFAPLAETCYLDHPLKFATPTRKSYRSDGPFLWVGVRSNLPPLVTWVNAHSLPAPLDVLTNPEQPGHVPTPAQLGFRSGREVRIHEWTPERHLQFTRAACAALDIKGDDFRSRHKPPAKALDFIASGLPLALNPGSSPAEHLAELGLRVPSPLDTDRWLSQDYAKEVRRLGERLSRELAPERVAGRFRKVIESALADRPAPTIVAVPGTPVTTLRSVTEPTPVASSTPQVASRLYGLMITKDDHSVFQEWCRDQLGLYDAVVCLDGSEGEETARIATQFPERLIYLREWDFRIPHKTDHGLRAVVHNEIVQRFGHGHWIMCCHADEFCYHDPRKIIVEADRHDFDQISWYSLHFYPHPDEWPDWAERKDLPVHERHRYYHWSYRGDGFPWCEDRLYRDSPTVAWDGKTHGNVRPQGLSRPAPFHPIFRHYKVLETEPGFYDTSAHASHYRTHWIGTSGRTGVPFPVHKPQDLFVRSVKNYARCDKFEGTFAHPWNMGEQFRCPSLDSFVGAAGQRYRSAQDLAAAGEYGQARVILSALDSDGIGGRLRALVKNDLAVLAAVGGDSSAALAGFQAALELDPICEPARTNLATLDRDRPSLAPLPPITSTPLSRPIRVVVISFLFNWPSTGGGNIHTAELTKFLAQAGYEVRHFYAQYDPWEIGLVTDQTLHPAQAISFDQTSWTVKGIIERFSRAVDAFDPDWVILTDSWNLKPLLAACAGGRPYILRLQALECLCPLNNVRLLPGTNGVFRQCTRHQLATPNECYRCIQEFEYTSGDLHRAERELAGVGSPEYREIFFRAFANAAMVLAVNPLTAAMIEPHTHEVRVVTAGMDPARFPWPSSGSNPLPRNPARLRILFAGLITEWMKGFHILREACGWLWVRRQDFEVVVTDQLREGEPEPWARYMGWQSQTDLAGCMAGADIVVVPTVAQEALGRTAVEGMAAGKPVVASRIGGLSFTIPDGATGLLCEPGNPADLAAKLTMLLDDRELRDRLGRAGRRRFEEHYAWPAIIERHYRPILTRTAKANR